jgi:ATP synthase protein I
MTAKNDHGYADEDTDEGGQESFKTLTREEAALLSARFPPLSLWRVVALQALIGLGVAIVWFLAAGNGGAAWSALYGAACAVLPQALLARGLSRRPSGAAPGAAVLGFMFWEAMKIALAVAMLAAALKVVPDLSWPALLVTMIVCMKASWLALLMQRRSTQTS